MDTSNNANFYKKILDMRNSEAYQQLQKFYHRKTIFDILGVSRQENPHSSFISWLLNPNESHNMNDFPLRRFLETVCFAYEKYGINYLSEKNPTFNDKYNDKKKSSVRDKLLFFNSSQEENLQKMEMRNILMRGDYRVTNCTMQREKSLPEKRRADIFIELSLKHREKEEYSLLILIENKVKSSENDQQTNPYMNFLLTDEKAKEFDFVVPILLSPVTNKDLKQNSTYMLSGSEKKIPCVNRLFLLMNYQYLMDGVISPCLTAFKDTDTADILLDYISCLGKSIETNESDDSTSNKEQVSDFDVMAVSRQEKSRSVSLWEDHRDVLENVCRELSGATDEPFFTVTPADRQFYRTVLTSVLAHFEENEKEGTNKNSEEQTNLKLLRNALKESKRQSYYVMQKNGKPWEFTSGKHGKYSLGALAYAIIKQYIDTHNKESIDGIVKRVREKIKHSWLRNVLITNDELKELVKPWLICRKTSDSPICTRYYASNSENGQLIGCILINSKDNPLKENDNSTGFSQEHSCPLHNNKSNQQLCFCIYDLFEHFFVGNLEEVLKNQSWKINDIDASQIFEEKDVLKRANKTFGPIFIERNTKFVLVARYWGTATIQMLLDELKMGSYVSTIRSKPPKEALNFNIEEL